MVVLFVYKRCCCEYQLNSVVSCQDSLPLTKRQKNVDNFLSACRTIGVDEVRFQLSFLSHERHERHPVLLTPVVGHVKMCSSYPQSFYFGLPDHPGVMSRKWLVKQFSIVAYNFVAYKNNPLNGPLSRTTPGELVAFKKRKR